MRTLYIVGTPIGNLEDITWRALRTLKEAGLIAAEDTRKTLNLLNAYSISTPLTSYHEHNKREKLPYILGRLELEDVALVSEAGMPGMSDPGNELVVGAVERGFSVIPVPGPSAVVTALAVSGLSTRQFLYLGFLPRKESEKRRLLEGIKEQPYTVVIFEAPHRFISTLEILRETLGERKIAVCRELTKLHEEVFRGTVSQALSHFVEPRGEFTLVLEGGENPPRDKPVEEHQILAEFQRLHQQGVSAKEATEEMSEITGISRRELYRLWLLAR